MTTLVKYPGQPRDSNGRFASGGGSSSFTRPLVVLGGPNAVSHEAMLDYMEEHGREYEAAELPEGVSKGTPKECHKNASQLALQKDDLEYVEGIAYPNGFSPGSLGFLHSWCVDGQGRVVDNTWDDPEKAVYFGVKYDKSKLIGHMVKTGMYGVFGGDDKAARKVIEEGGL